MSNSFNINIFYYPESGKQSEMEFAANPGELAEIIKEAAGHPYLYMISIFTMAGGQEPET